MLIVFSGLSGSGKTYSAKKISEILKCPYLNSDIIRKELAKINLNNKVFEDFGKGIYSESFSDKTYKELIERGKNLLKSNKIVVIDATFSNLKYQKLLIESLSNFIFIFCYASDDIIKERLEKRIKDKYEVSDGRWEIYLKQKENFQGLIIPEEKILKIDTGRKDYLNDIIIFIKDYRKLNLK